MSVGVFGFLSAVTVAAISTAGSIVVALIQSRRTLAKVAEVSRKVDPVSNGFAGDVSGSLRDLNIKFDRLDSKVDRLDGKVDRLDERVARLEKGAD